ncbi:MAG: oxidoreductase, partial [Rhodopirellula bahusiensis]
RATETSEVTVCISLDDGTTWQRVAGQPDSFRSDVMAIPEGSPLARTLIAVGPAGTDHSRDGMNWAPFSAIGFHCLSAGKTKVFACGSDGRFARLE